MCTLLLVLLAYMFSVSRRIGSPWVVLFACYSVLLLVIFSLCLSCNFLSWAVLFVCYALLHDEVPHAVGVWMYLLV